EIEGPARLRVAPRSHQSVMTGSESVAKESKVLLHGIGACVFDAYGTLLDFRSAALRCKGDLGDDFEALNTLWRDKQLQYTWLRSIQNEFVDFRRVTADALDYALDTLGITDAGLRDRLMTLYTELDVFPEVPGVLRRLKAAGLRT